MLSLRHSPWKFARGTLHCQRHRQNSSISKLQAAFRDPSSPFHIPPGSIGPDSPDPPSVHAEPIDPLTEAREQLLAAGFDPASFMEQTIVWGDQDSFKHVNNARYVRFFESARIKWMMSLGNEIGGPTKAQAMITGQGVSLILKSIEVQFRRPVTYPDTLLVGHRPYIPDVAPPRNDPATFHLTASAYSLSQRAFVAHSKEVLVWYDYDKLKKCDPGDDIRNVVWGRMKRD